MKKSTTPLFDYHDSGQIKRKYGRTSHGGVSSKGKRKEYRPLAEKKWIHLTLKSAKAKGDWSFLTTKNRKIVNDILKSKAKKWGVQLAEVVNVGNHLHIKLRFKYREGFQNFLRAVTSLIARKITNARRGYKIARDKSIKGNVKFWQGLAFTRVIRTRIEELQLKGYFQANRVQARKGEKARRAFLDQFNLWVRSLRAADATHSVPAAPG